MLRTPLYYSVANSHAKITELLISSNANVTVISSVDPDGEIDLYELAESKGDRALEFIQNVKQYVKNNYRVTKKQMTALNKVYKRCSEDLFKDE